MWRTNFIGVVAALLAAAPVLAQTGTITGTVTSAADGPTFVFLSVLIRVHLWPIFVLWVFAFAVGKEIGHRCTRINTDKTQS